MNLSDVVACTLVAFALQPRAASAQAIDCFKTTNAVQKTICTDSDLSSLDVKMASLYRDAIKHATPAQQQAIAAEHSRWVTTSRDSCAKAKDVKGCVTEAYAARNAVLTGYATGKPLPSSGSAAPSATYTYRCEDKSTVKVTYTAKDQARVKHGTSSWTLPHVTSASGAHYAAGKVSVWNKGRDLTFQHGKTKLACTEVQ